jgi:dUTP pyrophosphatase
MSNKVMIKKLKGTAVLPIRGSAAAAGYDLYACIPEKVEIRPHKTVKIGTGLGIAIPEGYFGAIYARSGLAAKRGLRPANCVGVVDADYRGEVIIALHNDGKESQFIEPGERIAQLVITPFYEAEFVETDELPKTTRGEGGFGSTGTN